MDHRTTDLGEFKVKNAKLKMRRRTKNRKHKEEIRNPGPFNREIREIEGKRDSGTTDY